MERFKEAMKALEAMANSDNPAGDLDQLTKALQEVLGVNLTLVKSEQEPEQTSDDLHKSQADDEFDEELVKASEAYADLQKSVEDGTNTTLQEIDVLKKSLGAALNLLMTLAGTVEDMRKSQQENLDGFKDELKKSLTDLGATALAPNAARLGLGEEQNNNGNDDLRKSKAEIQNDLIKAVQDGKVDAKWLSDFGTYKNAARFPDEVKEILGLNENS